MYWMVRTDSYQNIMYFYVRIPLHGWKSCKHIFLSVYSLSKWITDKFRRYYSIELLTLFWWLEHFKAVWIFNTIYNLHKTRTFIAWVSGISIANRVTNMLYMLSISVCGWRRMGKNMCWYVVNSLNTISCYSISIVQYLAFIVMAFQHEYKLMT